jgi:hypothetical protein
LEDEVKGTIELIEQLHQKVWQRVYDEHVDVEGAVWHVDTVMDHYKKFLIEEIEKLAA